MSFQRNHTLNITLQNTPLTQVRSHRHLGLIIQADLRWTEHIHSKIKKARRQLFQLRRIRDAIHKSALINVYCSYVRPIVEYGSLVLSNLTQTSQDKLESLQRRAGRVCLGLPLFQPTHHSSLLHHLSIPTLSSEKFSSPLSTTNVRPCAAPRKYPSTSQNRQPSQPYTSSLPQPTQITDIHNNNHTHYKTPRLSSQPCSTPLQLAPNRYYFNS